jgi:hypothetical protein
MISNLHTITYEQLNTFHELLSAINQDSDGDFFICREDSDLIEEANKIIDALL